MMSVSRISKPGRLLTRYRHFFVSLFILLLLGIAFILVLPSGFYELDYDTHRQLSLDSLENIPEVTIKSTASTSKPWDPQCTYYDCFDVYKCRPDKIKVYVYPLKKYVDENGIPATSQISREFYFILKSITESPYYTANPEEACIFIPSFDTLSQSRFRIKETSQALASLPYWNGGHNHVIFSMVSEIVPGYNSVVELNLSNAMVAGAGFSSWTYRSGFDISIPMYTPVVEQLEITASYKTSRPWLVVSSELNLHPEYLEELRSLAIDHPEFLLLELCHESANYSVRCHGDQTVRYPHILQEATFCLILHGARLGQSLITEALATGCIPVLRANSLVLPFQDILDWKKAAVVIHEDDLGDLVEKLKEMSDEFILEMQEQIQWLYQKYFSSLKAITRTTLDILNDRVFPQNARTYEDWNSRPNPVAIRSPLFLPLTVPRSQGFTAVVLTYDRVESLFQLINKLVKVPSLNKVLVVWNNQRKPPPSPSLWPKINKPLKVIQTRENKLSNRFYPYEEIETEAILTIDDDIVMLTADELEFGYEVWREFPDRIVGFPSRTHVWDNTTQRWKYESEWTNQISMVLTGAAFHHKYWSYMYTTMMPGDIKAWVDENMNCEDIAMNFLVANITGKAPIKVTPRKKFKCPECTNTEMLSADLNHMIERSNCIDRFASVYGTMPLQTIEFRADPVLYKDIFPEKLKRFNQVGSL